MPIATVHSPTVCGHPDLSAAAPAGMDVVRAVRHRAARANSSARQCGAAARRGERDSDGLYRIIGIISADEPSGGRRL
ncbi:hypothetical protein GCM10011380_26940 [Sphingomonas metalli]|uniref:Uncharacterized protein n=1 Tax=Sphingomonas metalli TaxID=1779358 RepID=A0A916T8W8_9SPHN|nr:hypothetical protein GCM10011380_26940 [Sphingomonas metalli]